jgi:hypothetical protein
VERADTGVLTAKGQGGQLSFDGSFVTIGRKGLLGRTGRGKGEKRIPIASINAVRWKPAGAVMNGYIALTLAGAIEQRSGFGHQTASASKDENSVLFTKQQQPEFERMRDEIETALAAHHAPAATANAAGEDQVAQLARLAALHEAGSITDEEFAQMKARLVQGSG